MTSEDNRQTGAMSAAQMLDQLSLHGGDAGSHFNDSDEVLGWFEWSVDGDMLRVRFTPQDDDGSADEDARVTRSWRLVEITDVTPEPWASVQPGDPHPPNTEESHVRACSQQFDEEGLRDTDDASGWVCTRDRHADPLHVATTGANGGYVCATYNAATHEYRRRAH